ncbi:MAG: hypothetical protein EOP10_05925 [Proteobacteria bacterium]|nr:MAG: hypothetical protein EOP10_05925 [Pseudomonadota bacterium]
MRLATPFTLPVLMLGFALFAGACTTSSGSGSEGISYDGNVDGMDSLPDCSPDSQGSIFWVKDKNGAFECMKDNQWKKRANAKKPDDAEDEESGDQRPPRIVK